MTLLKSSSWRCTLYALSIPITTYVLFVSSDANCCSILVSQKQLPEPWKSVSFIIRRAPDGLSRSDHYHDVKGEQVAEQ